VTVLGSNDGKTRVLQAVNIVELIGQTVKLKRRGGKYVGLCPFHSEKTPSFSVDPGKQFFYCFGCKANGNAIDFVMKRDRIEFVEALRQLADQTGVDLPRFSGEKQNTSERQVLFDAHSAACMLFEKQLSHPQLGEVARGYLSQRGFNAQTLKKFQVGLAVEGWDTLLRAEVMRKFPPALLATAGLVKPRENGGFYDTFRSRIMFPIRDEQGRIIAFGGRVMPGAEEVKYLNSPETPLFSKGRCVFGLDFARQKIVETRTVAVVEGYTDVVMAHQYGATNVVSVLGTAMTEQHVQILRRFADRVVLLFDADAAGDLAVNRAVELFLTQPVEIAIASMPDGLDPDEYLMQHGVEAFERLLADSQDALSFKWRQLRREYASKDDVTSQQQAVGRYMELLAGARGAGPIDPIRWGQVLTRVSRLTEIPVEQLNRRFKLGKRRPTRPAAQQVAEVSGSPGKDDPAVTPLTADDRAENQILGVLLVQPQRWARVQEKLVPASFTDERRRKLAEAYWTFQRDEGEPAFNELLGLLDEPAVKELAIQLVDEIQALDDLQQTLDDALLYMEQQQERSKQNKHLSDWRRTSDSSRSEADEIEMLRRSQEFGRKPDIRRTAT
jgi:DNA primase